ncbi:type II secretion system protein GspL [Pseudomonas sp. WS 5013]|uniref:type II secretion system protein GspL n=1 Tax=Pseudomonas sp. WS 5013 TaxID=2717475 RepID=UPI0031F94F46
MMDCLFLGPECGELADDCQVHWLREDGECLALSLRECAEQLRDKAVTLVLPIEAVSSFLVELPTAKDRWIRQALPFAVEEMLAEDVELFHLALGPQHADQRHRVVAVRRDLLAGWQARLDDLGLDIAAIHVDADMLPVGHGGQALLLGERGVLGGDSELRMAFAAEQWPVLQGVDGPWTLIETDAPYRVLFEGRSAATNLAQAEFARRTENQAWVVWRPAVLMLGLGLFLHLGFALFQAFYYEWQAERFAQTSLALYKELFPEDKRIVNLRAQLAEHLKAGAPSSSGFLNLMEAAAVAVAQGKGSVSVAQMDYSQVRGDLALQVRAGDFAEVEKLRQKLMDAGLSVQMGSANREEDGVTARVILGGGQ